MEERQKEPKLPLTWSNWEDLEPCLTQFYNVIFEDNFGSINTGDCFDSVAVNYWEGWLEAYGDEGIVLHHVEFDFVAQS